VLSLSNAAKSLELEVVYTGGRGLNEAQLIRRVELYYDGGQIAQDLATPATISGPGRITIQLSNAVETKLASRRGYPIYSTPEHLLKSE